MANHRKNYDEAVKMYDAGMSIQDVADYYEVSRQAMWDALKRRGTSFRTNIKTGKQNHFYRGGVRQCLRARQLMQLAIEKGVIINAGKCESCLTENCRIEGHHDDYSKPLVVRWLCHKCHYEWHINNIPIECNNTEPKKSRKEICSMGGKSSWSNIPLEEKLKRMEALRGQRKTK